jgi:hypothetical protein
MDKPELTDSFLAATGRWGRECIVPGPFHSITIVNGLWEEFARRLDYEGLAEMLF